MLMKTSLPVRFWTSCLSLSTSCPLRPMMMPGREVWIVILSLLAARSISTLADAGVGEALLQVLLEREVLVQQVRVFLLGVPAAAPGLGVPEAEPDRMDFLTHRSCYSFSATWTVMCVVRLMTR